MKCPTCGERWFDSDEEYSIEPCARCQNSGDLIGQRTPNGEAAHVVNPGRYGATYAPAKQPTPRTTRRGRGRARP